LVSAFVNLVELPRAHCYENETGQLVKGREPPLIAIGRLGVKNNMPNVNHALPGQLISLKWAGYLCDGKLIPRILAPAPEGIKN
jgi:hypothetical protein